MQSNMINRHRVGCTHHKNKNHLFFVHLHDHHQNAIKYLIFLEESAAFMEKRICNVHNAHTAYALKSFKMIADPQ